MILQNEYLRAEIKSRGAELVSVKNTAEYEYIWQADEKIWAKHCPVFFPICGRLVDKKYTYGGKTYEMNSHGFASTSIFREELVSETEAKFILTESEETLKQYPFRFVFTVRYALEKNTLSVEYRVENPAKEDLYFSFGAHEAYNAENFEKWSVELEKKEDLYLKKQPVLGYLEEGRQLFEKNVKELPLTYKLFENDALIFDGLQSRSVLLKRDGTPVVKVEFSDFKELLLWTKVGAPYLCIEPWNGLPDYVGGSGEFSEKKGIIRLGGGKTFSAVHKITFF